MKTEFYGQLALMLAEKWGVIEYRVKGNKMVFYSSWPGEHSTVKCVVDLDTMKETRHTIKRYYPAYSSKIGGRYVANYCA